MLLNIGLISYGTACLAYSLLAGWLATGRLKSPLTQPLLGAALATALWAGVVAGSTLAPYPAVLLIQLAEIVRDAAWAFLLIRLIGLRLQGTDHILASNRWLPWFFGMVLGLFGLLITAPTVADFAPQFRSILEDAPFTLLLGLAIAGLLLLEQIYRNSTSVERWSSKHLSLGLGFIFAYDFFMYAEALLFRQLDPNFWQARGIVTALAAILLAVAVRRLSQVSDNRNLYVSRHVAFHTITLLAAGIYLLAMALVGYFIRYLGGTWGGVLQITFLGAAGLLLLALLFSGQIRARLRVWLSKNFFSYKYDYRVEWLQFTRTLASGGNDIPENIIRAMAHLTQSPGGLLWSRGEDDQFELVSRWEMAEPEELLSGLEDLPDWLQRSEWIVNLREWDSSPDLYDELQIPELIRATPRAWLIIPLMFGDQLQGILLLLESELQSEINWEDRDLLKVAGRQAASHLAEYQANLALVESRQFEAFNRLSAYVIHDLKNILAQQALIVSNAARHRDNPAFVDDVLATVENSVARMTRLMEQMRSGVRGSEQRQLVLQQVLEDAIAGRQKVSPKPVLDTGDEDVLVAADREQLTTVFSHIIQNGQEATGKNGQVLVRLHAENRRAIVEIEDNGVGMDDQFLRERLFTPFDSTKGLTGMGIGAFESREFVRSLGGDIQVQSSPGEGSVFRIVLPCRPAGTDAIDAAPSPLLHPSEQVIPIE